MFDIQSDSMEDQGKQIKDHLEPFCKKVKNVLCTWKGRTYQLDTSLKTFYNHIKMFGRQHQEGMEKFEGEYQRFLEMIKLEDDLVSILDTHKRKLKKIQ